MIIDLLYEMIKPRYMGTEIQEGMRKYVKYKTTIWKVSSKQIKYMLAKK